MDRLATPRSWRDGDASIAGMVRRLAKLEHPKIPQVILSIIFPMHKDAELH